MPRRSFTFVDITNLAQPQTHTHKVSFTSRQDQFTQEWMLSKGWERTAASI